MEHDLYRAILHASNDIDLPVAPSFRAEEEQHADAILTEVESDIGDVAKSDYYTSSRARFAVMIILARRYLRPGAMILDVGNAPGYLALALVKCGFRVRGINLADYWLDAYPSPEIAGFFEPKACDIERENLPFDDGSFDAIMFTEVLEHIAIKHPHELLPEFKRVLRDPALVLFSTPNVSNLSNVIALMKGVNVFWPYEIFFGSTDRHNREFTPGEVKDVFLRGGFTAQEFFGINDHANWRTGTQEEIYSFMATNPPGHPMLRNTTVAVFKANA